MECGDIELLSGCGGWHSSYECYDGRYVTVIVSDSENLETLTPKALTSTLLPCRITEKLMVSLQHKVCKVSITNNKCQFSVATFPYCTNNPESTHTHTLTGRGKGLA